MGGNPGLSKRPLSDLMLFLIKEGLIAARNLFLKILFIFAYFALKRNLDRPRLVDDVCKRVN